MLSQSPLRAPLESFVLIPQPETSVSGPSSSELTREDHALAVTYIGSLLLREAGIIDMQDWVHQVGALLAASGASAPAGSLDQDFADGIIHD